MKDEIFDYLSSVIPRRIKSINDVFIICIRYQHFLSTNYLGIFTFLLEPPDDFLKVRYIKLVYAPDKKALLRGEYKEIMRVDLKLTTMSFLREKNEILTRLTGEKHSPLTALLLFLKILESEKY